MKIVASDKSVRETSTRGDKEQSHLVVKSKTTGRSEAPPKLIFIGGQIHTTGEPCSLVDTYDITGGNPCDVIRIAPLPWRRLDASMVAKNGCFYVIGGFDGEKSCDTVFRFTPNEMRWTELTKMSLARHGHTSSVVGDYVIIAGGVGNNMKRTAIVEAYDIKKDRWINLPDIRHGSSSNSASCEFNGEFVISGGFGTTNAPCTTVACFNMVSKRWRRLPDLQSRRSQHAMVSVNGELYVFGGITNRTIEHLDLNTNKFVVVGELPVTKCGSSAIVSGDSIILAGGWNQNDPIVVYNTQNRNATTYPVVRNCLSPHVALFKPEVLSLWVLSTTFIKNYLNDLPSEGDTTKQKIQGLPLPRTIIDAI